MLHNTAFVVNIPLRPLRNIQQGKAYPTPHSVCTSSLVDLFTQSTMPPRPQSTVVAHPPLVAHSRPSTAAPRSLCPRDSLGQGDTKQQRRQRRIQNNGDVLTASQFPQGPLYLESSVSSTLVEPIGGWGLRELQEARESRACDPGLL